jgi:glycolate oxidase FAD binding subunit
VQPNGIVTKAGGRVVKNVTGYDIPKLHVGALGTLGVVSEATFKLLPLPSADTTLVVRFDSAPAACAFATDAHDAGLALTAAEVLSPPASHAILGVSRWSIACRIAGVPAAVDRSLQECRAICAARGGDLSVREAADIWPAWRAAFAPRAMSLRVCVLPSQVAETLELLDRRLIGAAALLSATVSAGVIRAQMEPGRIRAATLLDHAREAAERRGGWVNVDAAPASVKRQVDVFGPLRPDFTIMRRLKEEFDPQGTLSPGRFAGRL